MEKVITVFLLAIAFTVIATIFGISALQAQDVLMQKALTPVQGGEKMLAYDGFNYPKGWSNENIIIAKTLRGPFEVAEEKIILENKSYEFTLQIKLEPTPVDLVYKVELRGWTNGTLVTHIENALFQYDYTSGVFTGISGAYENLVEKGQTAPINKMSLICQNDDIILRMETKIFWTKKSKEIGHKKITFDFRHKFGEAGGNFCDFLNTEEVTLSAGKKMSERKFVPRLEEYQLKVWDSGKEQDGDRVDIYVNRQLLAENLLLKALPKAETFSVYLHTGKNLIEVKALNLGDLSPNTVTFTLEGGGGNELFMPVQSDLMLGEKGYLEVNVE